MTQKNLPIITGVILLVLVIAVIIGIAIVPQLIYKPSYSFIYTYGERYDYSYTRFQEYTGYQVDDNRVTERVQYLSTEQVNNAPQVVKTPYKEQLYYYDVEKNSSRQISYEEAQQFTVDPNSVSPDGFELSVGNQVSGFMMFVDVSRDYGSYYLTGHNSRHKVNLIKSNVDDYYYSYNNLKFLGWVIE